MALLIGKKLAGKSKLAREGLIGPPKGASTHDRVAKVHTFYVEIKGKIVSVTLS
jgi:hypothetical protein